MAELQFYSYPGWGEWAKENLHYRQAVRIGDRIVCSGQGGWDPNPETFDPNVFLKDTLEEQIDQAFVNCDINLKHAGGKGMSQVFRVVTYTTDDNAAHDRIVYNLRKWMPEVRHIWTALGVRKLGLEKMKFEIYVEAYDPEGVKN